MLSSRELYETMRVINAVETTLLRLFDAGVLRGTVHTCVGQEGVAAGVVGALDPARDVVCSNHRGHGHYIAFTKDCAGLIAEVMGREEGVCRGVGGSQHLHAPNFYSNGVLGGMTPVATGMAFAEKAKGSGAVVAAFVGDGALGEGVVYEALNIAALWRLPILFVVEANGYAQSTPIALEQAGRLFDRAASFGVESARVDGNDVEETHRVASEFVAAMRRDGGARFLFCDTYRLAPHSKGDDTRPRAEIERAQLRSPIARLKATLPSPLADEIDAEVRTRIDGVVTRLMGRDEYVS